MNIRKIRLELARTKEFPDGSTERGYELTAPLTKDGHIDADAFGGHHQPFTVRRFWTGENDRFGRLHRTRQHTWAFSYGRNDNEDELLHHLEHHLFKVGEYVGIRELDGQVLPFRIVSVQ
ncbi:MAG TPA: hypothetical protein VMU69_31240 [Bradyrhizobium sp.]|nr:hypothetical protein [Bradyrhizobium sp.]